jgi:hypothetical protein
MESRNSPEIPPKFPVLGRGSAADLGALPHEFRKTPRRPAGYSEEASLDALQCDPLDARSARASTRSFVSTPSVNAA